MLSQISTQTGKFGAIVASNTSEDDDFTSVCEAALANSSNYTRSSPSTNQAQQKTVLGKRRRRRSQKLEHMNSLETYAKRTHAKIQQLED